MKHKLAKGAAIGDELGDRITESALSLRADLLAVRTERRIELAKQRNERFEGVFPYRNDPTVV